MAATMKEKKDPDGKNALDDPFDDEPIIDLIDEVIIESDEQQRLSSSKGDAGRADRVGMTDRAGSEPHGDEELFIMDDTRGAADDGSAVIIDDDAIEMAGDDFRDQYDQDNELDYELDDEEIDFFPDEDDIIPMPSELTQTFNEDEDVKNKLPDIDYVCDADEEIKPLTGLQDNQDDSLDDIIEITEFDQHFPEIDKESLENADLLYPSDLKDEDFIELFDIGDEDSEADEEIKTLSASEEEAVEAELIRFNDDPLEENVEVGNDEPQANQNTSEREPCMSKTSSAPIAEDHPVVSTEQIDKAIERIINEKLAGRIEHIIYEIIERTVKREIDKLKESLLDDSSPEDDI
jgi:hypothetical protein